MNRVGAPIIVTVLSVLISAFAVMITASTIGNISTGTEVTAKSIGFPVLLWFITLVFLALTVIGWTQRIRYVRATTPEERAAARVKTPVEAHRPGDALDYGTEIEDSAK